MADKQPAVYILASKRNGTLYVGVTSNLRARIWQHKSNIVPGFTSKNRVHGLVWYETTDSMESAIGREKQIKGWTRRKKIKLIESSNRHWKDLFDEIC